MHCTVAEYIAEFLHQHCSNPIYAISGASDLRLLDAIARHPKLRYICPHHEQAGVMSALTQTRVASRMGAMLVTAGPGSTNTVTGIADAWLDSIPVLVIGGQEKSQFLMPSDHLRGKGVQGLDMIAIVKSITKYAVRLMDAKRVRYELERCVYEAHSGRPGPVWVEIPQDIQTVTIDTDTLEGFIPPVHKPNDHTVDIEHLRTLISHAQRPLIWAGQGIRATGEVERFRSLVPRLGVPVLLSWMAADFLDDKDPLYVGRAGTYGQRAANFAVQNCDLLICLGTRLAIPQRGYEDKEFARAAKKVIVEIDPTELAKFTMPVELAINADVGELLRQLDASEKKTPFKQNASTSNWAQHCRDWRKTYPPYDPKMHSAPEGTVNSYQFIDTLSDLLKADDVIVTDMGTSLTCTHATIRIKRGQRLITSTGLGEMGYGLPGAIGAALGSGRRVVFIGTEGSLMMNIQELQTVIMHRLPIKIFILNNDNYLTIVHTERALFGERLSGCTAETGVTFPDLDKVFAAFGYPIFRIDDAASIATVANQVLATEGPVFCNVIMPKEQLLIPKAAVKIRPDGTIYSPPLEDLYPFLPREEFARNMIIPPLNKE